MRDRALRVLTALILVVVIGNLRGQNATGARTVEDFRLDVSKTMYAEQQMLGEHGDNSGKWTPKQLEIIQRQGLEEK